MPYPAITAVKRKSKVTVKTKDRQGRITTSIFHEGVSKVSETYEIKNPGKVKTILSKICDQKNNFKSKATEWGKANEPVARQEYIKLNTKDHKKLSVVETGLFVSCENPVFGALPDSIVRCECHESGLLEIKCPWTHRDKSVIDYAKLEEICFEVVDNKIALKTSHSYDYQVQMQLAVIGYSWCDFFLCTTKDSFQQKIYFDKSFWSVNKYKLEMFYSKVVVKELLGEIFILLKFDTEIRMKLFF